MKTEIYYRVVSSWNGTVMNAWWSAYTLKEARKIRREAKASNPHNHGYDIVKVIISYEKIK